LTDSLTIIDQNFGGSIWGARTVAWAKLVRKL